MLAFEDEISVDLITYNRHAILYAEISDCGQLLLRPDSSDRVVRIAEEKELYAFGFQLLLEILHIHVIAVIIAEHQRAADNFSAVIRNDFRKWIINR